MSEKLDDQKLVEAMNSGRMISASENIIFPMLEKLIADRLNQACGKFLLGTDQSFVSDIAYIQGLK